jgi:hypothetical protein
MGNVPYLHRQACLTATGLSLLLLACISCSSDNSSTAIPTTQPTAPSATTPGTTTAPPSSTTPPEKKPPVVIPPPASLPLCERLIGGANVVPAAALPLGWSKLHSLRRFFGIQPDRFALDGILVDILNQDTPWDASYLSDYIDKIGACQVPPSSYSVTESKVSMVGDIAVVVPGTSPIAIPANATRIALDLRQLPETPQAIEVLESALLQLVSGTYRLAGHEHRECHGLPDEGYTVFYKLSSNVYQCATAKVADQVQKGTGSVPLVLLTGQQMSPSATRIALSLRMANLAHVVGSDVLAEMAEQMWVPIGTTGATVRWKTLMISNTKIPDSVPADISSSDPLASLEQITTWPELTTPVGEVNRAALGTLATPTVLPTTKTRLGEMRASALLFHGTANYFFPYFDVVPNLMDETLLQAIAAIDQQPEPLTRAIFSEQMQPFSLNLNDGHAFIWDFPTMANPGPPMSTAPSAAAMAYQDKLYIAQSIQNSLPTGAEILSVDGIPAHQRWLEIQAKTSGSPQRRQYLGASSMLWGADQITIRTLEGQEYTVMIEKQNTVVSVYDLFEHPFGYLDTLNAPSVYYLSLAAEQTTNLSNAELQKIKEEIDNSSGLILDNRSYPGSNSWKLVAHVLGSQAKGPLLSYYTVNAEKHSFEKDSQQKITVFASSSQAPYQKPVVMLVNPTTQSQAEHLTSFFVNLKPGPLLGLPTAGANGNITVVAGPGNIGLSFTGMRVLHQDGSVFHQVGHVPDYLVETTPQDLHDGQDTQLKEALKLITQMQN